jgi:hypothetical protein
MRATRWISIALVALATGSAGCGEDRTTAADPEPPATSATTATTATPPDGLSDRALARRALLRLTDFPAGWVEQRQAVPDVRCGGVDPFGGATAVVGSGRMAHEDTGVQQTVSVFRTAAASRRAYALINSPEAMRCLRRDARQRVAIEAGGPAQPLELARIESLGRWGVAKRFSAQAAGPVGKVSGYIDVVHLRVGRGLAALVIVAGLQPLPDDLYARLEQTVEERLSGNLG